MGTLPCIVKSRGSLPAYLSRLLQIFKMPVTIYGPKLSAPVRIALMTCEALGIEYEVKPVDLMKGEHMTPDYLKINPQHNVPALVDGDFKLNESRAIALYLVNAHGKDNKLYPADPKARAIVDQRMYFDMGNFYDKFGQCVYPLAFGAADKLGEDKVTKFEEVLGWVNGWVEGTVFADGTDQLTLADICFAATLETICATLSHADFVKDFDTKYPNLKPYLKRLAAAIPNYASVNGEGAAAFGGWIGPIVKSKM